MKHYMGPEETLYLNCWKP